MLSPSRRTWRSVAVSPFSWSRDWNCSEEVTETPPHLTMMSPDWRPQSSAGVPDSGAFTESDTVHAEITLTNTGDRKGTEVVQLYIGDIVTSYSWTDRELKAFQRVELEPGKSKTVVFDIPVSDCTIVDSEANRIVEPGEFEVLIGHSSRREHLKRTTFTVA